MSAIEDEVGTLARGDEGRPSLWATPCKASSPARCSLLICTRARVSPSKAGAIVSIFFRSGSRLITRFTGVRGEWAEINSLIAGRSASVGQHCANRLTCFKWPVRNLFVRIPAKSVARVAMTKTPRVRFLHSDRASERLNRPQRGWRQPARARRRVQQDRHRGKPEAKQEQQPTACHDRPLKMRKAKSAASNIHHQKLRTVEENTTQVRPTNPQQSLKRKG